MNLEHICEKDVLMVEIDAAYIKYIFHTDDSILRDSFNAMQMMYHELFKHWYDPMALKVSVPIQYAGGLTIPQQEVVIRREHKQVKNDNTQ